MIVKNQLNIFISIALHTFIIYEIQMYISTPPTNQINTYRTFCLKLKYPIIVWIQPL